MGIIPKILLDHITLQFSYGSEHQFAKPGELEGAHMTEVEYFIDEDSGKVIGRTNNPLNGAARPLDPAKVAELLGDRFVAFEAQLSEAHKERDDAATAAADAAQAGERAIAERDAAIAERDARIADISAAADTRVAELTVAYEARLAQVTAAHADLSARIEAAQAALIAAPKGASSRNG
jgi:hypothetical protein